jgi:hypothetical protein
MSGAGKKKAAVELVAANKKKLKSVDVRLGDLLISCTHFCVETGPEA